MCAETLHLWQELTCQSPLGVAQYRTERSREAERGSTSLLSSLHDSGIDLLTVASRVTLAPCYFISSLIVVLGVLYVLHDVLGVRIYISFSLSLTMTGLCHDIFNIVRI